MSATHSSMVRAAGTAGVVAVAVAAGAAGVTFGDRPATTGPKPQPAFTLPTPLSDHLILSKTDDLGPSVFKSLRRDCPAGYVVTGGGESNTVATAVTMTDSFPVRSDAIEGWLVWVHNSGTTAASVTVYAVCQKVPT